MRRAGSAVKEDSPSFVCPNPACPYYGQQPAEGGKLWVDQGMGKEKKSRLLRCAPCRQTFSERRGPALQEARLPAAEPVQQALLELKDRLVPGHVPGLVTTDEHSPYVEALLAVFGHSDTPERQPGPGAPKKAVLVPPELVYAQVDKHRSATGRVEQIEPRLVFGTSEQVEQRLAASPASPHVNPAFIERANGCDRHRHPRTARKVLSFSKQGAEPRAGSWLGMGLSLCCWVPRTLRQTPAMIRGKATRVLTGGEFLHLRSAGDSPPTRAESQAGTTPFHQPEVPPAGLAQWPDKRLVQRSFHHLGVNARGLG